MQEITQALTWTFLHSLWQGLLAALLAAIIISYTRRSTARLRYNMLGIVMMLFMVGTIITFITQLNTGTSPGGLPGFGIPGDGQTISSTSPFLDNFMSWVNANASLLILAWTFFFLFSSLRLVTGIAAANRLRSYKVHPVPGVWRHKLEQLQQAMQVRVTVSFLQSELVKVPVALGVLKPVILVPLGLLTHLPAEQIETILLHELAHIRRKDYLINLLQHVAETIFFFNPAMRWISSLIRQEREACCDDMVVASGSPKTNYLNALVSFQEFSQSRASYAMGISSKRQYLLNRVKRILTNKNTGISLFEKLALLTAIIGFSAFSFMTQQKEVNVIPAMILQEPAPVTLNRSAQLQLPLIKKEKKNISTPKTYTVDTIPHKKDTIATGINKGNILSTDKDLKKAAADAKLQEIIELKDQIGLKKESIGEKKQDLIGKDGKEKDDILKKIADDRIDVEKKRKDLEKKRREWDILKKDANWKPRNTFSRLKKMGDGSKDQLQYNIDSKKEKQLDFNVDLKQEFQYKMDPHVKDQPDPPKTPTGPPMKLKGPDTPVKKII